MPVIEWEDEVKANAPHEPAMSREEMFDKAYWNGGGKVGGYAREGYWDFPAHEVTFRHVMARRPESVLEVGCARGYVGKRLQDAEVPWAGLEISKHCWMTRACDSIHRHDLCRTPWPKEVQQENDYMKEKQDICFSIAVMEHVPERFLPAVIKEMARTCKRGLHGIDFGGNDDGFDQTHVTLKSKAWWIEQFRTHAPGWPVEVVDKEDLERGIHVDLWSVNREPGVVKLNLGSFTTMSSGWLNMDVHDLGTFAQHHGYEYLRHDVRSGLSFKTGTVDLIASQHMLEHLDYRDGLNFLRECRRVLRPGGALRIGVPDAKLLIGSYVAAVNKGNPAFQGFGPTLEDFNEINDGCSDNPTTCGKFWSLIAPGHLAAYDDETLLAAMTTAGFKASRCNFREAKSEPGRKIVQQTIDMIPCLSLYAEGTTE